jgi:hypothetical protein
MHIKWLLLALMSFPAIAPAQSIIWVTHLATYHSNNGSVAPPYRREMAITIDTDGKGTIRQCTGYRMADAQQNCASAEFWVPAEAIEQLLAAVQASDLVQRPIKAQENPPVGGGITAGTITLDNVVYPIDAFPVAEDAERASALLYAILAVVPPNAKSATSLPD